MDIFFMNHREDANPKDTALRRKIRDEGYVNEQLSHFSKRKLTDV